MTDTHLAQPDTMERAEIAAADWVREWQRIGTDAVPWMQLGPFAPVWAMGSGWLAFVARSMREDGTYPTAFWTAGYPAEMQALQARMLSQAGAWPDDAEVEEIDIEEDDNLICV
ncbi:MAG: hypothetical protein AAFY74_08565 [Pseudomonadota bacterium]